ncbi:MAG: universal stress protein [Betaproteobacteria bacterium]|nr:universal stress protein [Betaproteobacteria bacterium]
MLKLLLPIDNSSKLDQALRYLTACQRESRWPLAVHVLHVGQPLSSYVAEKLPRESVKSYHAGRSQAVLGRAAEAFAQAGIAHTTHTVMGDPAQCIVRFSKEIGADRIVMVTHARESVPEVLLGSVAARVLRHAPVPVEVVPVEPASRLSAYARAAGVSAAVLGLLYLATD